MSQEANNETTPVAQESVNSLDNLQDMNLKEIVQSFQEMLDRGDQQEMYKYADSIKATFYKVLKKEKIAVGYVAISHEESSAGETPVDSDDVKVSENPFAEIERGFKDLYNRYKVERGAFVQTLEKQKEENLRLKNNIIEGLKELLEKQENLQDTFPAFRELQNRWKVIGPVPQVNNKDLWENYHFLVEKFYDYVKINNELRDLDLKKNLELKMELCEKAEALIDNPNVIMSFRELQKYHEEWRELGPVLKEKREEIWERFKAATTAINKRQQEYFDRLKDDQKKNLELKEAICEKLEAIVSSIGEVSDWNVITKEVESLQREWKKIGFASKKDNQKLYDRFREACDKFFNAKRGFYDDFKKGMQENLEKKIALCEQAETVMDSEDWKKVTDLLISLQKKWKEIGPVARKQSDAIWKRFRSACDHFFDKKSAHFSKTEIDYEDNLAKKRVLIEEINSYVLEGNRTDDIEALKDFQERWNQIGFVPMKDKEAIIIAYRHALDAKFGAIRNIDNENKIAKFRRHIKEVQSSSRGDKAVKTERDKLVLKFRQIEQEIALLENNIGFFAKSKKAESIIKEIEAKIAAAKEELSHIEEKIKLIDNQYE
jgi:Domain of Unknown Function (DUF349).